MLFAPLTFHLAHALIGSHSRASGVPSRHSTIELAWGAVGAGQRGRIFTLDISEQTILKEREGHIVTSNKPAW
jgi:hypothetical protein